MVTLQKFTKLPIEIVVLTEKIGGYVLVKTPHKGDVEIEITKKHYPFIFGSITETRKNLSDIIEELNQLENESVNYLFNEWINKQ